MSGMDKTNGHEEKATDPPRDAKRVSRRMALLQRAGLFRDLPEGITITRATSLRDIQEAYRLVHSVFIEQGYIRPFPGDLRVRPFEALPETATFVARSEGQVVSVQSLVPGNDRLGVPSDRSFSPELDALRAKGRRVCEAANEAVASEYRRTAVPTELMRCCLAHAVSVGCTDVVTAISPGHAKFYGLLGFETISPIRSFSEQLDDPVLLVRLDLAGLGERFADVSIDDGDDEALLKRYYIQCNPYVNRVGPWSVLAERLFKDPLSLRVLFDDVSSLLSRCNLNELRAIGEAWGQQTFVDVIGQIGAAFCGKPQWRTSDSQTDALPANTGDGDAATV